MHSTMHSLSYIPLHICQEIDAGEQEEREFGAFLVEDLTGLTRSLTSHSIRRGSIENADDHPAIHTSWLLNRGGN